jgi:glycosyltransferase involved in cell wall biosynthesis
MSPSPKLDIVYLLQEAENLWGGVMNVFREAEALNNLGHNCQILCPTELGECYKGFNITFQQVENLCPQVIPQADLIIGTYYSTVPIAWNAERLGKGKACHYCQGYEGDSADLFDYLSQVERNYLLPGLRRLTINNFLAQRLETLFGWKARVIPYGIGPEFHPSLPPSGSASPLRIGLVGPWEIEWKDLPTGLRGIQLAKERGLEITLVRMSPIPILEDEQQAWGDLHVEAHECLQPQEMASLYRSLDFFVGSSRGGGEGFFLPALEAMASGIPCVLSDIPCFHSYSEPSDYALFFPAGSPGILADRLLSLGTNISLQRELRKKGLDTAKAFSFDSHIRALEVSLQELKGIPSTLSTQQWTDWDASEQALNWEQDGDAPKAIAYAMKALEEYPSSFFLWESLGRILGRMNRLEEAKNALQSALTFRTNSPSVLGALAFCQCKLGEFDEAILSYKKAILLGLPGPRPHLDLALIHLGRGETSAAIEALKEAQKRMAKHGPQSKARERIATEIDYLSTLGKPECAS